MDFEEGLPKKHWALIQFEPLLTAYLSIAISLPLSIHSTIRNWQRCLQKRLFIFMGRQDLLFLTQVECSSANFGRHNLQGTKLDMSSAYHPQSMGRRSGE